MKRTLCVGFVVLLVFALSVPCMAAQSYQFRYDSVLGVDVLACDDDIPSGVYDISASAPGLGDIYLRNCSIVFDDAHYACVYFDSVAPGGGINKFAIQFGRISGLEPIVCSLKNVDSGYIFPVTDAWKLDLFPSDGALLSSVDDGLDSVIGWVGAVADSLMFGSLAPLLLLLTVPISVTALVFSIKAIKKNSWGV